MNKVHHVFNTMMNKSVGVPANISRSLGSHPNRAHQPRARLLTSSQPHAVPSKGYYTCHPSSRFVLLRGSSPIKNHTYRLQYPRIEASAAVSSSTAPLAQGVSFVECTHQRHAGAVKDIFNDAIHNSTALYEYKPRTDEFMQKWFQAKEDGGYPIIGKLTPRQFTVSRPHHLSNMRHLTHARTPTHTHAHNHNRKWVRRLSYSLHNCYLCDGSPFGS